MSTTAAPDIRAPSLGDTVAQYTNANKTGHPPHPETFGFQLRVAMCVNPEVTAARIPSAGSLSTPLPSGRREGLSVTIVITAALSAVATAGSSLDSVDRS